MNHAPTGTPPDATGPAGEGAEQGLRRAVALHQAGRFREAEEVYAHVLALRPDYPEAMYNRGLALAALGRHHDAIVCYDAVLLRRPGFARAECDRGAALCELDRYADALASFERALAIEPRSVAALHNRAIALVALHRYDEAVETCSRLLAIAPDFAPALNNRGSALIQLRRHGEALASLDRAVAADPRHGEARYNRGNARASLGQHADARDDLAVAHALNPALPFIEGMLLHSRMHCADWREFDTQASPMIAGVRQGASSADPLSFIAVSDCAADQLQCARTWIRHSHPRLPPPLWRGERYAHERLRVAYLSADLREHPVAHLLAELFERHDRSRFETMAVSLAPAPESSVRSRLVHAFDHFVDGSRQRDEDVATMLREREIDIAVDLTGITAQARTGILAWRPAPVQVNYLGFPGTIGASFIDYLIADRYVIPEAARSHYAEQVVYLPDTFQPNDATRLVGAAPSRAALGLPGEGFVYCCFNNSYKITPAMFVLWLRLLQRVPHSVLWLVGGNATVEVNLRRAAEANGVDAARLVFAPRVDYAAHLARCAAADLFLDTLPFNAGTTASDALWAGLPVLTASGDAFAARMAGSLLTALRLPELIASDLAEYEARAVELATDAGQFATLRAKLAAHRTTAPLFDSDRYRRHLEAAYVAMSERARRGDAPCAFAVAAHDGDTA